MEIIQNTIDDTIYFPSNMDNIFLNKKAVFFDIETTGFSRVKNNVVLIGMLYQHEGSIVIKQFFAETLEDEKELLTCFRDAISDFDICVTYNGDTFDIPFLNTKYQIHNMNFLIDKESSLDLLKVVKSNKDILELENCKLKTVERKLGIHREDKISGKESVEMYNKFLKNKNQELKEIILQHNYDDILYLPRLLNIYDFIKEYSQVKFHIPYNNEDLELILNLDTLSLNGDMLSISGGVESISSPQQVYYDENFSFKLDPSKGTIDLSLQIHHGHLSSGKECFYVNTKDFNMEFNISDQTEYNVPVNLLIIEEGNSLIYPNIKNVLLNLLSNIFKRIQ